MQWMIVIAALAGFMACAHKAQVQTISISNWPERLTKMREAPSCYIPGHPEAPTTGEPYRDPVYGVAYVPRRQYEDLLQYESTLNDEVRGLRECLDQILNMESSE